MKKSVLLGMALLTLVLLGISFVPTLFLENGDRLVWQLDNWVWIFSSLFIAIIGGIKQPCHQHTPQKLLQVMNGQTNKFDNSKRDGH